MAQSGYTPILIYASSTPGALPSAANLTSSASGAELAINYADGKLYFKNSSGVVTLLAGSSSGPAGGSNTQVQYNSSGVLAGSSNMTFNGTKLTVAGFLDSALTSGRVPYATTSGELTDSANLLYSGTDLTVYGITVGRGAGGDATNTAVGASALANTSGAFNVAVGANAASNATSFANATVVGMNAISTGVATGTYITAIGTSSLQKLTSGSYITGVGVLALKENTTGSYNTALGVEALQANATASNNTAVGYQAGYSNVTGTRITALGYVAGYYSTGNYNLFAGSYAGQYSTGSFNTAVGDAALSTVSSASGSYNTAVGQGALTSNTTASNNTAVGYQAGYNSNRTADTDGFNTFVGYKAGYNVTTGQVNVFIGSRTGTAGAAGITGSANTVVGDFAGNALEGSANTNAFFGQNSGYAITTGSKNTIIGSYGGNQGGLDIRTASNYIVLSDGDGNPRAHWDSSGNTFLKGSYVSFGNNGYIRTDETNFLALQAGSSGFVLKNNGNSVAMLAMSGGTGNSLALEGASVQTGVGITFPPSQAASSNANTLDDYEEGTWTAGLSFGSGTTGITYSSQSGAYIKIGNQVTAIFNITLTNKGSSTGSARVTGLPFTTTAGARGGGSITYANTMGTISNCGGLLALVEGGQTFFSLRYFNTSSLSSTDLTESSFSNTSEFWGIVTYTV